MGDPAIRHVHDEANPISIACNLSWRFWRVGAGPLWHTEMAEQASIDEPV